MNSLSYSNKKNKWARNSKLVFGIETLDGEGNAYYFGKGIVASKHLFGPLGTALIRLRQKGSQDILTNCQIDRPIGKLDGYDLVVIRFPELSEQLLPFSPISNLLHPHQVVQNGICATENSI